MSQAFGHLALKRRIVDVDRSSQDGVCSIVLVGRGLDVPEHVTSLDVSGTIVRRAPENAAAITHLAAELPRAWLLAADAGDEVVRALAASVHRSLPELKLAALGPAHDPDTCERWLRTGAAVYLACDAPLRRVIAVLRTAATLGVVIVDGCFGPALNRPERAEREPARKLTEREQDVVRLLRRGMRNADIARHLSVTESTVEFHVRHILEKLGAKNRTEAVVRSILP